MPLVPRNQAMQLQLDPPPRLVSKDHGIMGLGFSPRRSHVIHIDNGESKVMCLYWIYFFIFLFK